MEEYEAITERLFGGDDNIERFRTSVALGTLKRSSRSRWHRFCSVEP